MCLRTYEKDFRKKAEYLTDATIFAIQFETFPIMISNFSPYSLLISFPILEILQFLSVCGKT